MPLSQAPRICAPLLLVATVVVLIVLADCQLAASQQSKTKIHSPGSSSAPGPEVSERIVTYRAYQMVDEYLEANAAANEDVAMSMRRAIRWLESQRSRGLNLGRNSSNKLELALSQFTAMPSADCFRKGLEILRANQEAIKGCGRKAEHGRVEPRRIERMFIHYRHERANKCQAVYARAAADLANQLEPFQLNCIQNLALGTLRGQWLMHSGKQGLLLPNPMDWAAWEGSASEFFEGIPFSLANVAILKALFLPKSFFFKALAYLSREEMPGERPENRAETLRHHFERYLKGPCERYLFKMGELMEFARIDITLVDPITTKEQFKPVLDLHFAKACFSICRKLLNDRRALSQIIELSAANE